VTAGWHIGLAVVLVAVAGWFAIRATHPEHIRGATDEQRLVVLDNFHISRRGWRWRLRLGNALTAVIAVIGAVVLLATI
jgi:hypothetical protein